jgi:hypothetical protein
VAPHEYDRLIGTPVNCSKRKSHDVLFLIRRPFSSHGLYLQRQAILESRLTIKGFKSLGKMAYQQFMGPLTDCLADSCQVLAREGAREPVVLFIIPLLRDALYTIMEQIQWIW